MLFMEPAGNRQRSAYLGPTLSRQAAQRRSEAVPLAQRNVIEVHGARRRRAIFFRQENLGAQCSNGARLSMTLSWLVSIPERERDDTKIATIAKVSNNRIKEEARAVYSPAGAVAPVCHLALCHLTTATPAKMISIAVTSRSPNGSRKNNQPMAIATTAFIYG